MAMVTSPASAGSEDPVRLFSLDDHEVVHRGLEMLAQRSAELCFLGAVTETSEVIAALQEHRPDIVLLDLFIGEEQGWDACRRILQWDPEARVVFYSAYGNTQLLDRAMSLGASGFILKSTPMDELPSMLKTVMKTGQVIDPSLLASWVASRSGRVPSEVFADEELEILALIAQGYDNYEIAQRRQLSFHTVKFHIGKMLKRTGEQNRAALVRYAQERHLID